MGVIVVKCAPKCGPRARARATYPAYASSVHKKSAASNDDPKESRQPNTTAPRHKNTAVAFSSSSCRLLLLSEHRFQL